MLFRCRKTDWVVIYLRTSIKKTSFKKIKGKMKLFQTVRKNLIPLGYIRDRDGCRYKLCSTSHLVAIAISVYTAGIISIFIFATLLADSSAEYMDSVYILAVLLSIFVSYMTTILNMTKLFGFIDNCEKVCDESKFQFYLFYLF